MDVKLELVPVPVSDVDRALVFYRDGLGWHVDVDHAMDGGVRIVQVTPPGSGCSIGFGTGLDLYQGTPVRGVHLVVADAHAARAELVGRGVDVTDVTDVGGGVLMASFADPDGNGFLLQEMPWRSGDAF
ncbi:glyoxalase [Geodermatophilus sp. Leaf369]|uniref:VOC family protein n=1 Tax=Geodermatophilus sp. Leaf369 TaxID=1736354 RepID=UPI0006F3CC23|nr:VOC family protein [Geodermatophilus sp. Leaf369]KQS56757.1 glyoxalase [Geodermatophilus sp. Leaf369]QNG35312.1 glyoxalase [Geodermatophilaceae bacterium NBWT11]